MSDELPSEGANLDNLVDEFNLTRVDNSDLETFSMSDQQLADLKTKLLSELADSSTAKQVLDALGAASKVVLEIVAKAALG